jgi:hypothetical protein
MQTTHFRNIFNLHGHKVSLLFALFFMLFGFQSVAQKKKWVDQNLPNYDQKSVHYGFSLAYHTSFNRILYSEEFVNMNDLVAINPKGSPGFSVGFLLSKSFAEFWEFRFHPAVAFYENRLDYHLRGGADGRRIRSNLVEGTRFEVPLLLKFRSERNGNTRMYFIGGIKPSIEAAKRKDESGTEDQLELNRNDLAIDFGIGWEQYFNFFKFSPEIRFSYGLPNLLKSQNNDLSKGLEKVTYNSVTIFLNFQ